MAPNFQWLYTYQVAASVQQQINKSLVLSVAYAGSLARNLSFLQDINNPLFDAANPALNTTSNVLARNLVSPGNPNATLWSATVGTITAQATGFNMRQMQFGLRLKF